MDNRRASKGRNFLMIYINDNDKENKITPFLSSFYLSIFTPSTRPNKSAVSPLTKN